MGCDIFIVGTVKLVTNHYNFRFKEGSEQYFKYQIISKGCLCYQHFFGRVIDTKSFLGILFVTASSASSICMFVGT